MIYVSDYTDVWIITCLLGTCATLVTLTLLCICGCRRETQKDDLLGVDGLVKITNPDENVSDSPADRKYVNQEFVDGHVSNVDVNSKRHQTTGNHHRSLPDIPLSTDNEVKNNDNGGLGDASSELYATVDDKTALRVFPETESSGNRHTFPNGIDSRGSVSQQSSISQTDSNYTCVKENPYDKVKKSENIYSKVQVTENEENSGSQEEDVHCLQKSNRNEGSAHSSNETTLDLSVLPGQDRNSSQSLHNSSIASTEIAAATAIAGRISASLELPYMTPPIQQPQYFSGDSQDSSKGYTSITVREPLANILQQTPYNPNKRSHLDPHYSTVSDDSDEMYAAIVEPSNQIYTSGSETYAQIQPITIAEVHRSPVGLNADSCGAQYEPAPQPPSVDSLKQVAHVHSRQASSSSCTSSVANLGSPKPEKRQANSPLPPPPPAPSVSPDIYNRADKTFETDLKVPTSQNLEDMYAKVHKTKKKPEEDIKTHTSSTADLGVKPLSALQADSRKSMCRESCDDVRYLEDTPSYSPETTPDYNCIQRTHQEHCYETLNKNKTSPTRETDCDIGYEKIRRPFTNDLESFVRNGPNSLLNSDPGYERVNNLNEVSSDIDPNYEVLHPERTLLNNSALDVNMPYPYGGKSIEDAYSVIDKNKKTKCKLGGELSCASEPGYESVPHENLSDTYATVDCPPGRDIDHNYESVHYLNVSEPPYESLNCDPDKDFGGAANNLDQSTQSSNESAVGGKDTSLVVSMFSKAIASPADVQDIGQSDEELMYFQV